jgi:tetratricopeptide (TPR) repeat protein
MNRNLLDQALNLHGRGRLAEAGQLYAQIVADNPQHADARHMLGVLRAQQGRNQEAHDLIAPVVAGDPRNALALANLGNVLNALRRHEEALANFDRALALAPGVADTWCNRGNALQDVGQLEEALKSYDRALSLHPHFPLALNNRANTLQKMRQYDAALDSYEQALALDPQYVEAHSNRADALQRLCRYEEALVGYDKALAIAPNFACAWNNRGGALQHLGRLDEAGDCFVRARHLAPDMAEVRLNHGQLFLLQQDFARGWPLFEARKEMADLGDARSFEQPLWTGTEDLNGKTLFVYIRLGLGDVIQFYRYTTLAQARGARVILSANDPLLPLLQSASPAVRTIGLEQVPEHFDYHIPLMSLPLALGTDIPAMGRYLAAEPTRVAHWRERIGTQGYRIAIAWQGDTRRMGAEGKSFAVTDLARIACLPGVRLINLQKNAGAEQLESLPPGMTVERYDFDEGPHAFLDSAAIMESCDLVISCDTALAHLAGALGVPNWLALKYVPDWRWFMNRSDTPWYSNTRLFRQTAMGDWASVFRTMEAALVAPDQAQGSRAAVPGHR